MHLSTIQPKIHLENEPLYRKHMTLFLKMFKLCNLKYHSCLSVIVRSENCNKSRAQEALLSDPEPAMPA
jgi:hypothetical protein